MTTQFKSGDIRPETEKRVRLYLQKIIDAYNPDRIYLTGSAVTGGLTSRSDLDFIVESREFIDPDAVIGAIDIIPYKYATAEMLEKALIIYERKN
ncbi:MAG: nucleotidyltransferase domain-containing protein [Rhodothermaceae bacterium]|nr:nucleotidyltransferase domain-containing protein [Rhodothermaceae bacterium]